jgi:hypothetical protein
VSKTTSPPARRSWIPHHIAWSSVQDLFALEVSGKDPDVVGFISTGSLDVSIWPTKKAAQVMCALIHGPDSLLGQLTTAVWDPRRLKPLATGTPREKSVKAHFHGAFSLGGSDSLLIFAGRNPPGQSHEWIPQSLKTEADSLYAAHLAEMADFEDRVRREKLERDRLYEKSPELKRFEGLGPQEQPPSVQARLLLAVLPKAATFGAPSTLQPETIDRRSIVAIEGSGWLPSRDGTYLGVGPVFVGTKPSCVLTWEPYNGPPAYPEVRWSVQRRLPQALRKPRLAHVGRPEFEGSTQPFDLPTGTVSGVDNGGQEWLDAIEDVHLDDRDYRDRIEESRKDQQAQGFEAIAWFQPYHSYSEEVWGIYFDARKLDDLALSLLDDFRQHRVHGSQSDAARLAFGLVYAHELFHARVEAALSWLEVNALQPRHLRYKQRVYDALRETPEWLEEALANWTSWDWFQSAHVQEVFAGRKANLDGLRKVVESSLDLSPPGYRDWRVGHQPATWRTFTTQLSTGQPKAAASALPLPLESTLRGPLPYDIRAVDIPLRFVGSGVIADQLQSHPATFNVPTRRELERALKFFRHILDASGGKGGHQKWTGPDQRAFILPTRDPVSVGVFKTFLQHLGIDKATYVREVRPNL